MAYFASLSQTTSEMIETALCKRVEAIRLSRNITQKQLAREAGVSVRTIGRMEKGEGVSLNTFIRVLIALGIQQNLNALLPDPSVRPIERVNTRKTERKRARPKCEKPISSPWSWGDEENNHE